MSGSNMLLPKCQKNWGNIFCLIKGFRWSRCVGLVVLIPKIYICLGQILCFHYLFIKSRGTTRKSRVTTRNSLFLLETCFCYSKLAFLTRNSLFLLETHFSYWKLTFLTQNSLSLLETHFSYSKLTTRPK